MLSELNVISNSATAVVAGPLVGAATAAPAVERRRSLSGNLLFYQLMGRRSESAAESFEPLREDSPEGWETADASEDKGSRNQTMVADAGCSKYQPRGTGSVRVGVSHHLFARSPCSDRQPMPSSCKSAKRELYSVG